MDFRLYLQIACLIAFAVLFTSRFVGGDMAWWIVFSPVWGQFGLEMAIALEKWRSGHYGSKLLNKLGMD